MADDSNQSGAATQNCFFDEWMNLQKQDLSDLLNVLNINNDDPGKNDLLNGLVKKNIERFEDYISKRMRLSRDQISAFYAPAWCTSLENSLLWIGGCRPSMFIRLVYALCGFEFESHLSKFLDGSQEGVFPAGDTCFDLSQNQLTELDKLQRKTIKDEEKLTTRWASFQEEIADQPLVMLAKATKIDELNEETCKVLDEHEKCMASLLEEADQLRISTLREVIKILTTKQAVDFLATSKKLHLCVHAWGKKRDAMRSTKEN